MTILNLRGHAAICCWAGLAAVIRKWQWNKVERQKVALATLGEIIEAEFTATLGRSAADLIPRVAYRARSGEPNWDVDIGILPPATLSAFLSATDKVKALYDLDDASHARLPRP